MAKEKTYGEILEKLWAKHEGKVPYKEVQKMAHDEVESRRNALQAIKDRAAKKRADKKKATEKKAEDVAASGGKSFGRSFRPMGEYS